MIVSIIEIVVISVLLFLIISKKKNIKDKGYEFSTKASKTYMVIAIIFMIIGYGCLIGSIILGIAKVTIGEWVLFGIGTFEGILSVILLYTMMYEKEHIINDTIVIRRFFKDKVINIKDIALIRRVPAGIIFLDKEQKKLFTMDINTGGLDEFFNIVLEKNKELESSIVLEAGGYTEVSNITLDPTDEEDKEEIEKYIEIGKNYKREYDDRVKEYKFNLFAIIIYCGIILVSIFLSTLAFFVIIIGIVGCLFVPNMIKKYKQNSLNELQRSDFEVGQSCAFKASNVVGNNVRKYRYDMIVVILLFVISLIFGLGLGISGITKEKVEYDKLSSISGDLVYVYEYFDDEDFIGIAIEGVDIEYRIPEYCLTNFDNSIFDLPYVDEEGNIIKYYATIYYYEEEPYKENSRFDTEENKLEYYLNAYYIKVEEVEYYNETLYNQAYISYKLRMITSGVLLISASIGCACVLVLKIRKLNKEKLKEVYKL